MSKPYANDSQVCFLIMNNSKCFSEIRIYPYIESYTEMLERKCISCCFNVGLHTSLA